MGWKCEENYTLYNPAWNFFGNHYSNPVPRSICCITYHSIFHLEEKQKNYVVGVYSIRCNCTYHDGGIMAISVE